MQIYDHDDPSFYSREYCFMGGSDPKRILMCMLRNIDPYTLRITDFSEKEYVHLALDNGEIMYYRNLIDKDMIKCTYTRSLSIHKYKVRYTIIHTSFNGEEHIIEEPDHDIKFKTLKIKLGFRLFRYYYNTPDSES